MRRHALYPSHIRRSIATAGCFKLDRSQGSVSEPLVKEL
jgi:hypothetical protein